MDEATFVGRDFKYSTVEVRFSTKQGADPHTTKILSIEKEKLLYTYKDRRSVRVRRGSVLSEIELEWVITAILSTTEEKPVFISVSRTNSGNLWGYRIEVCLFATLEDAELIPYQVEILSENSFKTIVEGRKPNCYLYGTRSHMKTQCLQYKHPQTQKEY